MQLLKKRKKMCYKAISFAVMREKQRRLYSSFTLHFEIFLINAFIVLVNECSFECSTGVFLFAIFRLNNVKSTARRPKRGLGSLLLARKQENVNLTCKVFNLY
jgi:hypothetical protein